ncbi:MAG: hypothetical protein ACTSRK_05525 [Promethearchaeota archaeon]
MSQKNSSPKENPEIEEIPDLSSEKDLKTDENSKKSNIHYPNGYLARIP